MKLFLVSIFAVMMLLPFETLAHSGGLNSYGCHNNKKTGGYHCHRSSGGSSSSSSSS